MVRTPTQDELAAFIIGHGVVDFISGGKLQKVERDAIWKVIKKLGPPAAVGGGRAALGAAKLAGAGLGATAYGVGKLATRGAGPLSLAVSAADAYRMGQEDAQRGLPYALQNVPMFPLVNPQFAEDVGIPGGGRIDIVTPALRVRKKVSRYAKNVGKAMKLIKASAKGGKKGTLSNPKKTFSTVSRTVSKIMKGGTRPRSGIGKIISKSVKGIFKKERKPKRKRSSRGVRYR